MSKKDDKYLSEEMLALIKVTPEMTEKFMSKLNYKVIAPPEDLKRPKATFWCTYCQEYTKFEPKEGRSSYCCIGCGISMDDYHIKTHNKLWEK